MPDAISLLGGFSTPVKAGWALWLIWGAGQLAWHRYGRVASQTQPEAPAVSPPRPQSVTIPPPGNTTGSFSSRVSAYLAARAAGQDTSTYFASQRLAPAEHESEPSGEPGDLAEMRPADENRKLYH